MNRCLSACALVLGSLALTPLAHADTYMFSFSGQPTGYSCYPSGCPTYSIHWQMPSTPDSKPYGDTAEYSSIALVPTPELGPPPPGGSYPFESVYGLYTGFLSPALEDDLFFQSQKFEGYGGLADSVDVQLLTGESFTSGPTSSLTFLPGTYAADERSNGPDLYGFLTVTDLDSSPTTPTSVTPEPSTLALLGTGVLGAVGTLRRRVLAR